MRSLSFKLTLIYVVSICIVVGSTIAYIEYNNYDRAVSNALRDAEMGPGFINGATPDDTDASILFNNPDSIYNLKSSDIENWLARFKPLFNQKVEGGVSSSYSHNGPIQINHSDYYNLAFSVTNLKSSFQYTVGPITVSQDLFPATVCRCYTISSVANC